MRYKGGIKELIIVRRKNFKSWWYRLQHIFTFSAVLGLEHPRFRFNLLPLKINLDFDIPVYFRNYYDGIARWKTITEHKTFEFEWGADFSLNTGIHLDWNMHKDHAGIELNLMFLGVTLAFNISDGRHWDEENNKWFIWVVEESAAGVKELKRRIYD